MLYSAAPGGAGRFDQCPHCRSRRPLRNVYECEDGHLFCETCAVGAPRGVLKILATQCPLCTKERADTVGHINWDLQQAAGAFNSPEPAIE
jgi:hypothetical protein